jgi:4-diphosphocytidyl-2-C-methyl-D-erythritol kinase
VSEVAGSSAAGRCTIRTPAKVNLGLRITGRRPDGYHLLESLFVPIDVQDDVEVSLSDGPRRTELTLEADPAAALPAALGGVSAGPDNLAVRAAEAFRAETGLSRTVRIRLRKRIPAGAGLGGGSSDAAAVLLALAELLGEGAPSRQALARIGVALGADVPFFLSPRPALVSGIGECIEPLDGLPELSLVLANPGISVATAEVYRLTDAEPDSLTPEGAGSTMRAFSRLQGEAGASPAALRDLLVNDLAPAAIALCPPIEGLMEALAANGARGTGLSGSGGTVFGVFDAFSEAERVAKRLADVLGRPPASGPEEVAVEAASEAGERGSATRADPWIRAARVLLGDE